MVVLLYASWLIVTKHTATQLQEAREAMQLYKEQKTSTFSRKAHKY